MILEHLDVFVCQVRKYRVHFKTFIRFAVLNAKKKKPKIDKNSSLLINDK